MTAYTPGPWTVRDQDTIVGPRGNVVAECKGYSVKATDPSQIAQGGREANACLIASAPALLEALAGLLGACRNVDVCSNLDGVNGADHAECGQARAAIAQAKGEKD